MIKKASDDGFKDGSLSRVFLKENLFLLFDVMLLTFCLFDDVPGLDLHLVDDQPDHFPILEETSKDTVPSEPKFVRAGILRHLSSGKGNSSDDMESWELSALTPCSDGKITSEKLLSLCSD